MATGVYGKTEILTRGVFCWFSVRIWGQCSAMLVIHGVHNDARFRGSLVLKFERDGLISVLTKKHVHDESHHGEEED